MSNNNWYSAESWYAPLHPEREGSKSGPEKRGSKRPRLSPRWRFGIGLVLLLSLIVLSSVLFSMPESESADSFVSDEMPEDWQDFFDSYYTSVEGTPDETRIEKADFVPEFELELLPAGDKALPLQELYEKCAKSTVSIKGYKNDTEGPELLEI